MPEIFVNYRTNDGHHVATILARDLGDRFGDEHVFMAHRSIPAGTDFEQALTSGVWGSKVLLCVIGPEWLTMPGPDGTAKIANEDDWVHRELVLAFRHGVHVIPVFDERVERRSWGQDLPDALKRLTILHHRVYRHREQDAFLDQIASDVVALTPELRDRKAVEPAVVPTPAVQHAANNSGSIGAIVAGPGVFHGDVGGVINHGPVNPGDGR